MTKLSVNINKVATLRNARGGNNPDVVKVALDCEAFGAEGITVHPRPDERHIRRSDVYELRPLLTTEFNIEGYPSPEFVDLVLKVKPHQGDDRICRQSGSRPGGTLYGTIRYDVPSESRSGHCSFYRSGESDT